jgi:hypothetical protein
MNRDAILFHLREAKEELDRTIGEIEQKSDYDFGEYVVAMSHLFHHLNTAWNGRDMSEEEFGECSEENFEKWRKFPESADLHLE